MLRCLLEIARVRRLGPDAVGECQRRHLAEHVAFARESSPFYRRLYKGLPDHVTDPAVLPVTSKKMLMPEFDDWVTDRAVTWERAQRFIADLDSAGRPFVDSYTLVTTSGTTGNPGVFVVDRRALTVNVAFGMRMRRTWLGGWGLANVLAHGGRVAMVVATGGHFLVNAGSQRLFSGLLGSKMVRVFSVYAPLEELVTGLNQFQPAIVIGYGSVLAMLAGEQEAGRLHISPMLMEPAGETVTPDIRQRMATVFGAKVCSVYGATECPFLTEGCTHGWYHVNNDWAVLEPVDADYRPVPPGELSHTILISNLANRVQPILRYDLGDSVLQRPTPCPCGNPLPAFQVQGRVADVLTFLTPDGHQVVLPPLGLDTLVDRVPGVSLFQLVQTTSSTLRVRLVCAPDADADQVWHAVCEGLTGMLADHGLGHVELQRATEQPQQSVGGKFRPVIPLAHRSQREGIDDRTS